MEAFGFYTKNEIIKGEYKETLLDEQKRKADILVTAISDKYTIRVQNGMELKGRGIKKYDNGEYAVTEKVYEKLKGEFCVMMDF